MFPRLKERRDSRGTDLSGGEQQMLAIARALVREPKILLLDEPFEGLAPIIVRDLLPTCRALAEAGQTILIVEQNISAAMTLADRVYVINNGHIVEMLTAANRARAAGDVAPPSRRLAAPYRFRPFTWARNMSVSDRLGGLSTDGFAKLTNSQPIHRARSTPIEYRWADDNNERLPAFAADLASRRVRRDFRQ